MASFTSPSVLEGQGLLGHDRECVRVVRAELGSADREGLREHRLRLGGVAQGPVRPAQSILQIGHDEGVADRVSFQIGGRPVEPVAEDRPQRLAFLLLRARVEIAEDRRQDLAPLFDLLQPLLRLCVGFLLALGSIGFRLAGTIGPDQSPGRARDAADQQEKDDRGRQHGAPVPPDKLAEAIAGRRRTRFHRFVRQITLDVARQSARRLVTTRTRPSPGTS